LTAALLSGWDTAHTPGHGLPPETAALLAELLESCDPFPQVRAVSVENSEDGPAFRVWVTAFAGPLQLELDRLQAAHRSLIVIAVRLPADAARPLAGPADWIYARAE